MNYLDDVDLKRLRIFDAVAKCGGFKGAEEALNINNSTICKAIAELEGRLGVILCKRGRGGFSLTEKGEEIYQLNFKLFNDLGNYVGAVKNISQASARTFRIAIVDNTLNDPHSHFLTGLTQLFSEHPNLKFDLKILASDDVPLSLLRGELDVAVALVYRNVSGLRVYHLYNEDVKPYVATKHEELWSAASLTLDDIANYRLATYTHTDPRALLGSHETAGFFFCPQLEGILIFGLIGSHVAMLPKFYAQSWVDSGHLKPINLKELSIDSPISAVSKVEGANQDLVDRFIEIMSSKAIFNT